jgi:hypothetical protein
MWLHLTHKVPDTLERRMISPTPLSQVVIRFSERGDERALARLAGRDTQSVPNGALLVAEADGELRAAVPLDGKGAVSDPFHRTADLVRLLELRRDQLESSRATRKPSARRRQARTRLVPAFVGRLSRR